MWTATIQSKKTVNGRLTVTVLYSNGNKADDFLEDISLHTKADIGTIIKARIDQLIDLYAWADTITIGPAPEPEIKALTPEQVAQQELRIKRGKLLQAKQDLDINLINETEHAAQVSEINSEVQIKP